MTVTVSTSHNVARLQGTLAHLDSGVGNAKCILLDGARAASANADLAPENHVLAEVTLTKPAGSITGGTLTLTQQANGLITTTGEAVWARFVNGDGVTSFDCDVGQGIGAWEVRVTQTLLFAGGDVKIVSIALG